jgi:uncharacterized glyoxalase superfamily protein PhnB
MFRGEFDAMLYARDVRRSARFYQDVLGFRFDGWWSDEEHTYIGDIDAAGNPCYAILVAGDQKLAVHQAAEDAVFGGGAVYHLRVADVDAYREKVIAAGGEPSEAKDQPWGWRMVFVKDPDGHQWGFFTPIGGSDR